MRPEKTFLIREASKHLEKSTYFFLTDYQGINADETSQLRAALADRGAEFHVVKNSSLNLAVREKELPDITKYLTGHTAIVVGGDDASGVAKTLGAYFKKTSKVQVKGGILDDRALSPDDVSRLAKLPSLEILQAQFLSLLSTPGTQVVCLLNQPAQQLLNVLQAKAKLSD
jgi:large subunit ribosomal protein L10